MGQTIFQRNLCAFFYLNSFVLFFLPIEVHRSCFEAFTHTERLTFNLKQINVNESVNDLLNDLKYKLNAKRLNCLHLREI